MLLGEVCFDGGGILGLIFLVDELLGAWSLKVWTLTGFAAELIMICRDFCFEY
jgi:hypothetical protein